MATGSANTEKPITSRNEEEVINALIQALKSILDGFPITADELQQRVDRDDVAHGGNTWVAAMVSIGEQRVLDAALTQANAMLDRLSFGF